MLVRGDFNVQMLADGDHINGCLPRQVLKLNSYHGTGCYLFITG